MNNNQLSVRRSGAGSAWDDTDFALLNQEEEEYSAYGEDAEENIDFELSEADWEEEAEEEVRPVRPHRRPASNRSRSSMTRSSVRGYSRPRSDSLSPSMSSFSFSAEPLSSASRAVSSRSASYSPQNDLTDRYGSARYGSDRYSTAAGQTSAEKTSAGYADQTPTEKETVSASAGRDYTTTSLSAGPNLSAGLSAVSAEPESNAGSKNADSKKTEKKRRPFSWSRWIFKMFFLGSFVLITCWSACGISLESNLSFWREAFPNDWLRIAGDVFSQVQTMVGQVHELIGMIFFS